MFHYNNFFFFFDPQVLFYLTSPLYFIFILIYLLGFAFIYILVHAQGVLYIGELHIDVELLFGKR